MASEGANYTNVNRTGPQAQAPVIAQWQGTYLGFGICKYIPVASTGSFAVSGSSQSITFAPQKPHKLIRFQAAQFSSGAPDATGININLAKTDNFYTGQNDILAATSGTLAASCIIFQFNSAGWAIEPIQYTSTFTGQSSDTLTAEFYIQYLAEVDRTPEGTVVSYE